MLSFRKKIFISYLGVFLIFVALMFPFATNTVHKMVLKAMQDRATELIEKIESAQNDEDLVKRIKAQRNLFFFRVSIITNERKVLYDSHVRRVLGPKFSQEYVVHHPEVEEAFEEGSGHHEDYSMLLGGQKFVYMAKSFDFHGKTYIMRTAFPYKYVMEITEDFKIGFVVLSTAVLLLFTLMTWFIINHLSKPIQQIITDIIPYQKGEIKHLPEIRLASVNPSDDFGKLANTLNSMSAKIQNHINSLTDERNEKEAILEALVEGVIAINPDMTVAYANQMALKFLGFENQNLLGQNFEVTNQTKCYTLLEDCQKEGRPLTENIQIKKEGQKIYLDIVAAPKKENSGAILVMQDKSAHYKILEMRKDFIANASHELKTPITIIRGFAETLHDNPDLPKETSIEITGKIVRNCQRMTSLIKDLLTLADIEKLSSNRLVECDLMEILEHAREMVLDIYPTAQISINKYSDKDLHVLADPDLMDLALTNLVENAAKYSNAPAEIKVVIAEEDSFVTVSITDKGIGIPENELENIFQRFYTVNKAHSQKMGGTGLGLAIVESIVEKHFGKITVTSVLGQGSTFKVFIPKYVLES